MKDASRGVDNWESGLEEADSGFLRGNQEKRSSPLVNESVNLSTAIQSNMIPIQNIQRQAIKHGYEHRLG
jgi:hypothetical protein